MKLGYATMNNLHQGRPEDTARALEERGFESFWIGEHAHLPGSGRIPYPRGGQIPEAYKHMADPFISLALASTVTSKIKLGLGVVLVLERDVFTTAKAIASLDQLTGGRVLLSVGVGWNREEFENIALMPWAKRYAGMKEYMAAMCALWGEGLASHQGEWVKFDRVWSSPKPLQKPWPRLYLGVAGPIGTRHAVEWGEGWNPIEQVPANFGPKLQAFKAALREKGRDPDKVPVTVVCFSDPSHDELKHYRDLGVERVILNGGSQDETKKLPRLDGFAKIIPALG
jgi:probable F420-dependent oxidoreductase